MPYAAQNDLMVYALGRTGSKTNCGSLSVGAFDLPRPLALCWANKYRKPASQRFPS